MVTKLFNIVYSLLVVLLCSCDKDINKIFLIGDSISIHYTPYLKELVEPDCIFERKQGYSEAVKNLDFAKGANGGDSRMVLDYISKCYDNKLFNSDLLLLNCGLHDIKSGKTTDEKQVSKDEYKKNLLKIYGLLEKMEIKLVWINTTPVCDSIHNSISKGFNRFNRDVIEYNSIADSIFKGKSVPIIDLYSFSKTFPDSAYLDHVHYKEDYRKMQAEFIYSELKK